MSGVIPIRPSVTFCYSKNFIPKKSLFSRRTRNKESFAFFSSHTRVSTESHGSQTRAPALSLLDSASYSASTIQLSPRLSPKVHTWAREMAQWVKVFANELDNQSLSKPEFNLWAPHVKRQLFHTVLWPVAQIVKHIHTMYVVSITMFSACICVYIRCGTRAARD